jgi:hypothetical protein
MLGDPKTNEWNLLKDQFDALVHNEPEHEDSFEKFLDDQIRRRFGEWIARATELKNKTDNDALLMEAVKLPTFNLRANFV